MSDTEFIPRWSSPPGDTVRDALNERSFDEEVLSEALGLRNDQVQALIDGVIPLTIDLADRLTELVGGSVEFWMTRDAQYRADLIRTAADAWAQHFPVSDMTTFGWIPTHVEDWLQQIQACLEFFDVTELHAWEENQSALRTLTRFRSSQAVEKDDYAVAAWLRQCDVQLSRIQCQSWNPEAFSKLLPELVPLSRNPDPREFVPELSVRCAEVGVAFGIVRAPRGCPISGAARRLSNGHPSIALTGRHKADDHLWFTFFHEAAHLVLHDSDALYLDVIEKDSEPEPYSVEAEADEYASTILIPSVYEQAIAEARNSPLRLSRLAREIGVALGIVVGHLQHEGIVGYATKLNRFKNRYRWDGPNLEKA